LRILGNLIDRDGSWFEHALLISVEFDTWLLFASLFSHSFLSCLLLLKSYLLELEVHWNLVRLGSITISTCISQISFRLMAFSLSLTCVHISRRVGVQTIILRVHKMLVSEILSVRISKIKVS
jgi:hypothetical protein